MATGQTLLSVRNLLKERIDDSLSVGSANDARYDLAIEKKQESLATLYDWDFLYDYWDCTVNSQYPTIPTVDGLGNTKSIDFDRSPELFVLYSLRYQPVTYGIGVPEWNLFPPSQNYTCDPILRWRRKPDSTTLFEVWPIPATFPQTVRFVGFRTLTSLRTNGVLDPTLTLELDDRLVAYAVAYDMQADKNAPSAVQIKAEWTTLLSSLRGNNNERPAHAHLGYRQATWANPRRRLVGMKVIATA